MENRKKEGGVFERDEWQGGGRKISRLSQRDVEEKPVQGCSESEMLERERKRSSSLVRRVEIAVCCVHTGGDVAHDKTRCILDPGVKLQSLC